MFQVSFLGTSITKAMDLLSGDQDGPPGVCSTWVICVTAPSASIQRTKSCRPRGWPSRTNATRVPSDDQRGDEPSVSLRLCEPSAFMIQRSEARLSLILSTQPRV